MIRGLGLAPMLALFLAVACEQAASPAAQTAAAAPPPAGSPASPPSISEEAPAEPSLGARMDAVVAGLEPLLACPSRIWGGFSSTKWQILFVSLEEKTAYLWNSQKRGSKRAMVVDFGTVPDGAKTAFFNLIDYEDVKTVAVSLDATATLNRLVKGRTSDYAALLAIHEGFHVLEQAAWAFKPEPHAGEASSRHPDYPDVWRLRYLRAELVKSLRKSATSGEPLGAAAHWSRTLKAEYPAPVASVRPTDVYEGSAQYATAMAEVLGKLGCDAPPEAIAAEIERRPSYFLGQVREPLTAAHESYDLGLLAGLALRRGGTPFEAQVAAGKPLVDVLLDPVAPVAPPEDPAALDAAKTAVEASNAAAAVWIEPLLARIQDPAATRLVVPEAWIDGAFSTGDSYVVVGAEGQPELSTGFSASLLDPLSKVKVEITNMDVGSHVPSPCGDRTLVLALPPGDAVLSADGATMTTATPKLKVAGLPILRKLDAAGRPWLCGVTAP